MHSCIPSPENVFFDYILQAPFVIVIGEMLDIQIGTYFLWMVSDYLLGNAYLIWKTSQQSSLCAFLSCDILTVSWKDSFLSSLSNSMQDFLVGNIFLFL